MIQSVKFKSPVSIFESSNFGMMLIYVIMRIFRVEVSMSFDTAKQLENLRALRVLTSLPVGEYHAAKEALDSWIEKSYIHIAQCKYDYNLFYKLCNALESVDTVLDHGGLVKLNTDLSIDVRAYMGTEHFYIENLKTFNSTSH